MKNKNAKKFKEICGEYEDLYSQYSEITQEDIPYLEERAMGLHSPDFGKISGSTSPEMTSPIPILEEKEGFVALSETIGKMNNWVTDIINRLPHGISPLAWRLYVRNVPLRKEATNIEMAASNMHTELETEINRVITDEDIREYERLKVQYEKEAKRSIRRRV